MKECSPAESMYHVIKSAIELAEKSVKGKPIKMTSPLKYKDKADGVITMCGKSFVIIVREATSTISNKDKLTYDDLMNRGGL